MKKGVKKGKEKSTSKVPKIVGLGKIEVVLTLCLTDEMLSYYNLEWDKIEGNKDLAFLIDIKELQDRFTLASNSHMINQLLFLNKVSNSKCFVELVTLSPIEFPEEEKFLKDVVTYVTEHNYLFLNESTIVEGTGKIEIVLKNGKNEKSFIIFNPEEEEEEIINEDGTKEKVKKHRKPNISVKEGEDNDEKNNEEKEKMEKEEKEKKNDVLSKITCDFGDFDYLFIDLEEVLGFQNVGFKLTDFRDFLMNIASYKQLQVVINYPNIISSVSSLNLEVILALADILSFTDVFLFEKKEAVALFNMLHQIKGEDENIKEIDDKHLEFYFTKQIKSAKKKGNKLAIFVCDFQKVKLIEQHGENVVFNNEYEFHLHPKINHTNQKQIEEYKKIIAVNYSVLKNIFFGSFFSKLVHKKSYYPSFLIGSESTKRMLEILKNKMEIPKEPEFYVIKLPKNKIDKDLEAEKLKKKEEKWVLDCINRGHSSLRYYNPLYDDHLNSFFSSGIIRKQLKTKGFINTNGYVMYDPAYRVMLGSSPQRKFVDRKEREKRDNSFEVFDSLNNINSSKIVNSNSPTNRKIPTINYDQYFLGKENTSTTRKKVLKPIKKTSTNDANINNSISPENDNSRSNEKKSTVQAEDSQNLNQRNNEKKTTNASNDRNPEKRISVKNSEQPEGRSDEKKLTKNSVVQENSRTENRNPTTKVQKNDVKEDEIIEEI